MLTNAKRDAKVAEIHKALHCNPVDVISLRKLAIAPGGLICKDLRCLVWPHLLDVSIIDKPTKNLENIRSHPECRQVLLDVERSGNRFPSGVHEKEVEQLQEELTDLILSVLCKHPQLNYYQGYHDICITFLFVCGKDASLPMIERLSTHHLRDFMDPTMKSTTHILNYLIPILEKSNPDLVKFMLEAEVGTVFALSWLITWFSYVIPEQQDIERLYDFFLSCHPLMPVYFAAQIVLDNANSVMNGECEMSRVYQILLQLARRTNLPLEMLISKASDFYIQFPPSSLAINATDYYKNYLAVSTFCDHKLVGLHESPDVVLRRRGINSANEAVKKSLSKPTKSNHWTTTQAYVVLAGGTLAVVIWFLVVAFRFVYGLQ